MAVTVTHPFVSAIADDPTAAGNGEVLPSHWNAAHTVVNALDKTGDTMTGTLTSTIGTITADTPVIDATQTWNNAGVTFTALKVNITDTASAANSKLMSLKVGGSELFTFNKAAELYVGWRVTAANLYLSGQCVLTGTAIGGGRSAFVGGFSNTADSYTGGAGVCFLDAPSTTTYALLTGVSAGLIELNNGTPGTYADINLRGVVTEPKTVATLPTGVKGMRSFVTDSNATMTAGIGAIVAGGGSDNVPVYYDGTNWRIG